MMLYKYNFYGSFHKCKYLYFRYTSQEHITKTYSNFNNGYNSININST